MVEGSPEEELSGPNYYTHQASSVYAFIGARYKEAYMRDYHREEEEALQRRVKAFTTEQDRYLEEL